MKSHSIYATLLHYEGGLGFTATGSAASPKECSPLPSGPVKFENVTGFKIGDITTEPKITIYTADKCYSGPLSNEVQIKNSGGGGGNPGGGVG